MHSSSSHGTALPERSWDMQKRTHPCRKSTQKHMKRPPSQCQTHEKKVVPYLNGTESRSSSTNELLEKGTRMLRCGWVDGTGSLRTLPHGYAGPLGIVMKAIDDPLHWVCQPLDCEASCCVGMLSKQVWLFMISCLIGRIDRVDLTVDNISILHAPAPVHEKVKAVGCSPAAPTAMPM